MKRHSAGSSLCCVRAAVHGRLRRHPAPLLGALVRLAAGQHLRRLVLLHAIMEAGVAPQCIPDPVLQRVGKCGPFSTLARSPDAVEQTDRNNDDRQQRDEQVGPALLYHSPPSARKMTIWALLVRRLKGDALALKLCRDMVIDPVRV